MNTTKYEPFSGGNKVLYCYTNHGWTAGALKQRSGVLESYKKGQRGGRRYCISRNPANLLTPPLLIGLFNDSPNYLNYLCGIDKGRRQ